MPRLEIDGLKQYIVVWAQDDYDENGRPTISTAVQKSARYEEFQAEVIANNNAPIDSSIVVAVAEDIAVGSQVRLGTLASVPTPPNNLLEVVSFTKIPDVKGRHFRREITLMKKNNGD